MLVEKLMNIIMRGENKMKKLAFVLLGFGLGIMVERKFKNITDKYEVNIVFKKKDRKEDED